jgi:hypothetical protein
LTGVTSLLVLGWHGRVFLFLAALIVVWIEVCWNVKEEGGQVVTILWIGKLR